MNINDVLIIKSIMWLQLLSRIQQMENMPQQLEGHIMLMHGRSRGAIRLSSADPMHNPVIDHAYLTHPDDITDLKQGN